MQMDICILSRIYKKKIRAFYVCVLYTYTCSNFYISLRNEAFSKSFKLFTLHERFDLNLDSLLHDRNWNLMNLFMSMKNIFCTLCIFLLWRQYSEIISVCL